jgi:hypothetical protein
MGVGKSSPRQVIVRTTTRPLIKYEMYEATTQSGGFNFGIGNN